VVNRRQIPTSVNVAVDFVDEDVRNVLHLIKVFNDGTHGTPGRLENPLKFDVHTNDAARAPVRLLVASLLVLAMLTGCGGGGGTSPPPDAGPTPGPQPEFIHEGLAGRIVERIQQHDDRLFALTDVGLFGKELGQNAWVLIGLDGFKVYDLAILDGQHMLATAVFDWDRIVFKAPQLYETLNGGANWVPVDNDFGGGFESEWIQALHYDPASSRLYATGHDALAVSEDTGRSWQLLAGTWDGVIHTSSLNLNAVKGQVWFGGQNAIEQMMLRRHDLASGMTTLFDSSLLPPPSTIKGITFDPTDPDHVLASGEGGILQSRNNGATWTRPLGDVDYRFYFETAFDPQDARTIYTARWVKNTGLPQPLVLEVSADAGASWAAYELSDPDLFGGTLSVSAVIEDGRTVLYLGLDRGGIMKVLLPSGG
jgi:hypothetical protein